MLKQKFENEKAIMILGLSSFICCCCTNGFLGIILSGIGIYLAQKCESKYESNPEMYDLGAVTTWKIVNYVSLTMSIAVAIYYTYLIATGKHEAIQEQSREAMEEFLKNFK